MADGDDINDLLAVIAIVSLDSATQLAFADQALFYGIERLARLIVSRVGGQGIVKVFPKLAMLLEIDLDGQLVPLFVGNEMNALRMFLAAHSTAAHE